MPNEMRIQPETITWRPAEWEIRPDVDIMVLICTKEGDLTLGSWDDEHEAWWDNEGEPVDALYWASVEGPFQ